MPWEHTLVAFFHYILYTVRTDGEYNNMIDTYANAHTGARAHTCIHAHTNSRLNTLKQISLIFIPNQKILHSEHLLICSAVNEGAILN